MLSLHIILTILLKSRDNIFCYHLYYVILLSFTKYITVYDNKLSKIIYDLTDHIERSLRKAHGKELPLKRSIAKPIKLKCRCEKLLHSLNGTETDY